MAQEKKTVLVVDDSPANIFILNNILKDGYLVKGAPGGEIALKIIKSSTPPVSLVLLDIMMPEMDGYQVCQRLKADPTTADIPVIFVSGHESDTEQQQGVELGAVGFITKPVVPETVLQLVAEQLA